MTLSAIEVNQLKQAPAVEGVLPVVLSRWSPRSFADREVSAADLNRIFEAAHWAASSYNEQPWRFLVGARGSVTHKKIFSTLIGFNQGWAGSAPVLILGAANTKFSHNGSPNGYALRPGRSRSHPLPAGRRAGVEDALHGRIRPGGGPQGLRNPSGLPPRRGDRARLPGRAFGSGPGSTDCHGDRSTRAQALERDRLVGLGNGGKTGLRLSNSMLAADCAENRMEQQLASMRWACISSLRVTVEAGAFL